MILAPSITEAEAIAGVEARVERIDEQDAPAILVQRGSRKAGQKKQDA